jgi:hypothetical protein
MPDPRDHGGGGKDVDGQHVPPDEGIQKGTLARLELSQDGDVHHAVLPKNLLPGPELREKGIHVELAAEPFETKDDRLPGIRGIRP